MSFIQKETFFNHEHLNRLKTFHTQLFLDNVISPNTEITSHTKTRIKNLFDEFTKMYSNVENYEKVYLKNVHTYIELINLAIQEKSIKFYLIDNKFQNLPYLMSYISTKETSIPFVPSQELAFDPNNPQHLNYLQNSFYLGINPYTSFSCDNKFLEILSQLEYVSPQKILVGNKDINFKNISSLFFDSIHNKSNLEQNNNTVFKINSESNEFFPNFLKRNLLDLDNLIHSFYKLSLVKNYDIANNFHSFTTSNFKYLIEKIPLNSLIERNGSFANHTCQRYISQNLLTKHFDNLDLNSTKNMFNSYKSNFFKNSLSSHNNVEYIHKYLSKFFNKFNEQIDDKFNHNDFFILYFLITMKSELSFNNNQEYIGEITHNKICQKYSKYDKNELLNFLSEIGFQKKDTTSLLSSIVQHKFLHDKYVFSSIDERNIYGFSMDRDEFNLPTKLSASNIKFILNLIEHPDFFYHLKGNSATFGVYSNQPLSFDKNACATMILDIILEVKKSAQERYKVKYPNNNLAYISYEQIIDSEQVNEIANKNIRQFVLSSILSLHKKESNLSKVSASKAKI